jgi:hypothetical protein
MLLTFHTARGYHSSSQINLDSRVPKNCTICSASGRLRSTVGSSDPGQVWMLIFLTSTAPQGVNVLHFHEMEVA